MCNGYTARMTHEPRALPVGSFPLPRTCEFGHFFLDVSCDAEDCRYAAICLVD